MVLALMNIQFYYTEAPAVLIMMILKTTPNVSFQTYADSFSLLLCHVVLLPTFTVIAVLQQEIVSVLGQVTGHSQ